MDKIFIRDLKVNAILGVYESERITPQEVLVNVVITTDLQKASQSDNLADSINYATLAQRISQHIRTAKRYTVEALCTDIASLCLSEPGVFSVNVRIEKPQAMPEARSVGVEIKRTKPLKTSAE